MFRNLRVQVKRLFYKEEPFRGARCLVPRGRFTGIETLERQAPHAYHCNSSIKDHLPIFIVRTKSRGTLPIHWLHQIPCHC